MLATNGCMMQNRQKYPILKAVIVLFVIKESFQLIAGLFTLKKGKMLSGARITGKISTTVLFVSLILMVLMPELDPRTVQILAIIDFAVLLISFADYFRVYFTHSSFIEELGKEE